MSYPPGQGQAPGNPTGPQMSPDGRFWWDGSQWQPVAGPQTAPQPGYGQAYPQPAYPQPGYPQMSPLLAAQRKSPGLHVLASFFIPGLGSILAGRAKRGGILLGLWAGFIVVYFVIFAVFISSAAGALHDLNTSNIFNNDFNSFNNNFNNNFSNALNATGSVAATGVPFLLLIPILVIVELGLWIFGMIDAHSAATQWNREHGILF